MMLYFSRPSAAAGSGDAGRSGDRSEELSYASRLAEEDRLELSGLIVVERLEVATGGMLRDCNEVADCAEAWGGVSRAMAAIRRNESDMSLAELRILQVAMKPPDDARTGYSLVGREWNGFAFPT